MNVIVVTFNAYFNMLMRQWSIYIMLLFTCFVKSC